MLLAKVENNDDLLSNMSVVDSGKMITNVLNMVTQFAIIGGALWLIWGVVVLAGGLKDKNGPGLQSGVWQIVGGALIIVAGSMFKTVIVIQT